MVFHGRKPENVFGYDVRLVSTWRSSSHATGLSPVDWQKANEARKKQSSRNKIQADCRLAKLPGLMIGQKVL